MVLYLAQYLPIVLNCYGCRYFSYSCCLFYPHFIEKSVSYSCSFLYLWFWYFYICLLKLNWSSLISFDSSAAYEVGWFRTRNRSFDSLDLATAWPRFHSSSLHNSNWFGHLPFMYSFYWMNNSLFDPVGWLYLEAHLSQRLFAL